MPGEFLTIRAYAQRRGCSHTAVAKAIKAGRLAKSVHRKAGNARWVRIDPELADQEWTANTNPAQKRTEGKKLPARTLFGDEDAPPAGGEGEDGGASPARRQAQAQALKTTYQAQIARLEYLRRNGTLVEATAVRAEAFNAARKVRAGLLNLPGQLSDELAAETDPGAVHQRLRAAVVAVLDELAGDIEPKKAGEDAGAGG